MNEIIIKYKRIKNIYIRIKPDLNIHVTAPKRVAKKYIKELTGVEYKQDDEIYKQAILLCISHFYCNRQPLTEKAVLSMPYTFESLVKHIGMRKND